MSKTKSPLKILQICQSTPKLKSAENTCTMSPAGAQRPAAWRQAGASAKFGREQTMLLPALCQTRLHPRLRETAR